MKSKNSHSMCHLDVPQRCLSPQIRPHVDSGGKHGGQVSSGGPSCPKIVSRTETDVIRSQWKCVRLNCTLSFQSLSSVQSHQSPLNPQFAPFVGLSMRISWYANSMDTVERSGKSVRNLPSQIHPWDRGSFPGRRRVWVRVSQVHPKRRLEADSLRRWPFGIDELQR